MLTSTLLFIRRMLAAILILAATTAYAQTTFQKSYGGASEEIMYATQQLNDGGYIMCGRTISNTINSSWDSYVVRLNAGGDTVWTKNYGNVGYDEFQSVKPTGDGGFIFCGQTDNVDFAGDVYLVKTDANGVVAWSKAYGAAGTADFGYCVRQTTDGGYIIAGITNSAGAGGRDMLLIKTTALGVVSWSKTYGGAINDEARSIEETSDGYIIGGLTDSYGNGIQMYVVKTTSAGVVSWSRVLGGSNTDYGLSVKQTSDNGYVMAGYTDSYGAGNYDVLLCKLTSAGVLSWSKTYGGIDIDAAISVHTTTDNGIVLGGRTTSFGAGAGDFSLIKTDAAGTIVWCKAYGGFSLDQAYSVIQTADGGYALAGYVTSYGAGSKDGYMVKTDANGASGCHEITYTPTIGSPTVTNGTGATEGTGVSVVSPTTAVRKSTTIIGSQCFSAGTACTVDASFTSNQTTICAGATVTFTNTSTGATAYKWKKDGVQFATTTNASQTFSSAGTFIIRLVAIDGNCSDSTTTTITVNATVVPAVNINPGPQQPLLFPTTCGFTAVPVNGGTTPAYQWFVNGVAIGNANNATFIWGPSVTQQIVVQMTSNIPCASPAIVTDTIVVSPINVTVTTSGPTTFCSDGSVTLTANPGTSWEWQPGGQITQTITVNTPGTYYAIVTDAVGCSSSNNSSPTTITVNQSVMPSVSLLQNPSGPICAGQCVTFTATPTNGGTNPTYQWWLNGAPLLGQTAATFTSCTLANGDNVAVVLTSNSPCANPVSTSSFPIPITVVSTVIPSVSITSNPAAPICPNTCITFTATPVNGGSTPAYQWFVNTTPVSGATNATFTTCTLPPGASVYVSMTSSATCPSPATVTSTTIQIALPIATIVANGPISFCEGGNVTLTANAGTAWVWSPGGNTTQSITVDTTGTYSVLVTNANGCTATASQVVTATPIVVPAITLTGSPNPANLICADACVTYTAIPTNGGSNPAYQWYMNGTLVQSGGTTFDTCSLVNGAAGVMVIMASNATCANPVSDTSNYIIYNVYAPLTPPTISQNGYVLTSSYATGNAWYQVSSPTPIGSSQNYSVTITGYYYVVYTDANGCTATSDTLFMQLESIDENANAPKIKLYPNPATSNITIEANIASAGKISLEIRNLLGQNVYAVHEKAPGGLYKRNIDLVLTPGIYFLIMQTNEGRVVKKIEIVK